MHSQCESEIFIHKNAVFMQSMCDVNGVLCVCFFSSLEHRDRVNERSKKGTKAQNTHIHFRGCEKNVFFLYELDTYNESNIHTRRWRCWSIFC